MAISGNSVLASILTALTLLRQAKSEDIVKFFLRSLQVYLLSFDDAKDVTVFNVDLSLSLVSELVEVHLNFEDPSIKYYCIVVLKRLSQMGSKQLT